MRHTSGRMSWPSQISPQASKAPARLLQAKFEPNSNESCISPDFNVPERARTFLKYVVTETLAGRADRIKAYSIAVEVFGRGASFDPQSDPVVRIEAGRVRRAVERYYLTAGSSDPIIITIPKGSYVPAFSRGHVSAEPKSAPYPTPSWLRAHSLALSTFALIVVAVATWAAFQWPVFPRRFEVSSPGIDARGPNIPKLLVEPFQNVTGTADGATIAIGLTEEVVGKLSQFQGPCCSSHRPAQARLGSFGGANRFCDAVHFGWKRARRRGCYPPLGSSHRPHQRLHPVGQQL